MLPLQEQLGKSVGALQHAQAMLTEAQVSHT